MKFIFVLHANVSWDVDNKLKGQTNIELKEDGFRQARELAKKLSKLGITLMASSDLKRARQTAEVINNTLNVPLYLEKGLRECSFGKLEGTAKEQAIKKHKELLKYWDESFQDYDFTSFDGEDQGQVLSRHLMILQKYKNLYPEETILIVGHSRGLSTLLHNLGYSAQIERGGYLEIEY